MSHKFIYDPSLIESYKKGESTYSIASRLGINSSTVGNILKKEGVKLRQPQGVKKYSFNENFFENIDSEATAYYLGFLYADGCVYMKEYRNDVNVVLCEKDISEIHKLAHLLNYTKPLYYNTKYKTYGLSITSKKMCTDLIRYGCTPRKSLTLQPPLFLPQNLINHFIRGYFDGDGSIQNKYGASMCVVGTLPFCEWLKEIFLNEASINCQYSKNPKTKAFILYSAGRNQMKRLRDFLYRDATIFFNRKKQIFDSL